MNLSQTNTALQHKIIAGSDFGWQCWPNARYLDYESEHAYASVVFNNKTQEIYSAEVSDKLDKHRPYRWMNPAYKQLYLDESNQRNIDPNEAWDDMYFLDLETSNDWCEKAEAMFKGESFDTRIEVPLDLEDDLLLQLAMEAHKRDITLNKMVEVILTEMIERHRNTDLKR